MVGFFHSSVLVTVKLILSRCCAQKTNVEHNSVLNYSSTILVHISLLILSWAL